MVITMKLMQKSAYENVAGWAYDMEQWQLFYFLAKIQAARSFDELL